MLSNWLPIEDNILISAQDIYLIIEVVRGII